MSKKGTGSKRGHHEGHVSWFEPRSCYRASIMFDGRRRWVYAKTRSATVEKLDQVKRELLDGSLPSGNMNVASFAAGWLESGRATWALKTYQNREYLFRLHINPKIGRRRLDRLQVTHVQHLYTDMTTSGASASLVNHAHRVLHACLQTALRRGYVSRNVSSLTERPRVTASEKPRLSEEEIRTLVSAAEGSRLKGLFVTGLSTGGRISELLSLTWDRIDLVTGSVEFTNQLKRDSRGVWTLGEMKTASSKRFVEIGASTVTVLEQHRLNQLEERIKAGAYWVDLNLVFCTQVGTPLSRHSIRSREWQDVVTRSGISKHLKLHSMRDIFASHMLSKGMNLVTVSSLLGHKNPATTLKHYSWAVPKSGRVVADAMDEIISPAI